MYVGLGYGLHHWAVSLKWLVEMSVKLSRSYARHFLGIYTHVHVCVLDLFACEYGVFWLAVDILTLFP